MNRRPLKKIAAELVVTLKSETKSVLKAGRLLAEAREQIDQHGEWLIWFSREFRCLPASRTAQRYQAAHAFALKYDTVSHLRLSTSALYSLVDAERAGHHEAVEAALAEAETQWIDDFRVWGIVASLQPPPEPPPDAEDQAEPLDEADEELEPDPEGGDEAPEDEPEPKPADDRPPPTPPPGVSPRQAAQLSKFEIAAKELLGLAARSAREFLATAISDFDLETAANFLEQVAREKKKLKAADSDQGGVIQMEEAKS